MKIRPTPLKDLQVAVHADQSRRYLILDDHPSPPSPAYPAWQAPHSPHVDALHYRWNDLPDRRNDLDQHYRSFTPPISPPAPSPREQYTEYSSKRAGRTFALVPTQVNGRHVLTHIVVNHQDDARSPSILPCEDGLPEDMQDILRQLDVLASWVKAASSSRDCEASLAVHMSRYRGNGAGGHTTGDELFPNKGKDRLLSASPPSECDVHRDLADSPTRAMPSPTNCQSQGFIYVPDCNTPEFLVGSSSSPIAYPVCGYSSLPSRYSRQPSDTLHDISYHHRFLERRSAPCPPPASPLISPTAGKPSFKTFFQRSRCNTTAVARPSIPPGHVPVENALRQGKRMRLPWLRI